MNQLMNKFRNIILGSLSVLFLFILAACQTEEATESNKQTEIEFILDWVPNTNHTGLFVDEEMDYFEEAGLDVTIRRPPEGSVAELVGTGSARFGLDVQAILASRMDDDVPLADAALQSDEQS